MPAEHVERIRQSLSRWFVGVSMVASASGRQSLFYLDGATVSSDKFIALNGLALVIDRVRCAPLSA